MKFQPLFIFATLCAITVFSSCKNDNAAGKDAAQAAPEAVSGPTATAADPASPQPQLVDPLAATPPAPAAASKEPPQNAAGVWHYTCTKGCKGGAGAPVACATCGTTLVHNQVYHGAAPSTAATSADKTAAPPPAPKPEPAQNKSGVWHYTCPGGCAGGGGSAGACAKCGKALAHNQAYHQ